MERAIDELKEAELVEEEALATWEQSLEELRAQPKEEWYEHASMEASDSLREKLENSMRSLAGELDEARASVSGLEELTRGNQAIAPQKLSPKRAVTFIPSSEKPKSTRNGAARSRLKRRLTP